MKAISLFSGMGGDSLGMVNAGLDLVAYSEKEKVFRETHDLNFKECKALGENVGGDITKIPDAEFQTYANEVDMIFAGFPCFVKGTQVLTDSGYKNIEDVTLDMKLVTHTGLLQNIVNLQHKLYTGTMYTVLYQDRKPIVCTEEHPFYVRTYKGNHNFSDPVWKAAKDLTMDDYCGTVTNSKIFTITNSYTKVKTESNGKGFCLREKCIIASVDKNTNETNYYTENEYTWEAPISFNTHSVENEDVYNFEVDKDNSYIVYNTIVHNCQSFSLSGARKGTDDPRGELMPKFVELIEAVEPKIFLIENVKGLLLHDDGKTLEKIISTLNRKDKYNVVYKLLNAMNYNVPQKRERVFIIGTLKSANINFEYPKPEAGIITLEQALAGVPSSEGAVYSEKKREYFNLIPEGGCWVNLPEDKQKEYLMSSFESGGGKRGILRRLSRKEPSLTLLCTPSQKQTERCHPTEIRPLQIKEYARIQTFPDDYEFIGSLASKYKQIGNAVPVELAFRVGKSLKNALN